MGKKRIQKLVTSGVITIFTKLKENSSSKLLFYLIFITSEQRIRKEKNEKYVEIHFHSASFCNTEPDTIFFTFSSHLLIGEPQKTIEID